MARRIGSACACRRRDRIALMDEPGIQHFEVAGRRIAYRRRGGRSPALLFLPGYASDMEGTKAIALDAFAARRGLAMLRLDYSGTGLHYAALNGHRAMVEFLLDHGADKNVLDTKVGSTAAGWAEYGEHPELLDLLR